MDFEFNSVEEGSGQRLSQQRELPRDKQGFEDGQDWAGGRERPLSRTEEIFQGIAQEIQRVQEECAFLRRQIAELGEGIGRMQARIEALPWGEMQKEDLEAFQEYQAVAVDLQKKLDGLPELLQENEIFLRTLECHYDPYRLLPQEYQSLTATTAEAQMFQESLTQAQAETGAWREALGEAEQNQSTAKEQLRILDEQMQENRRATDSISAEYRDVDAQRLIILPYLSSEQLEASYREAYYREPYEQVVSKQKELEKKMAEQNSAGEELLKQYNAWKAYHAQTAQYAASMRGGYYEMLQREHNLRQELARVQTEAAQSAAQIQEYQARLQQTMDQAI